ncbi:hypothetical protein HZS_3706 [Henneguya salminicola]|nr:hypothetical protein HZS_3706 [Henneguya salminicola]
MIGMPKFNFKKINHGGHFIYKSLTESDVNLESFANYFQFTWIKGFDPSMWNNLTPIKEH